MSETSLSEVNSELDKHYSEYCRSRPGSEGRVGFMQTLQGLISRNLGFVSCIAVRETKRSKKNTAKEPELSCLRNLVSDNVICDSDWESVTLHELLCLPTLMYHFVAGGSMNGLDVVVHIFHMWQAPPELKGRCPCEYLQPKHIGALNGQPFAVPVLRVIVGEKSRVVWVVEPRCELVSPQALALPSYQRTRWASIQEAQSQQSPAVFQGLKMGKDFLFQGFTRFRQRFMEIHRLIDAEDVLYLPPTNKFREFWSRTTEVSVNGISYESREWRLTKRAFQVALRSSEPWVDEIFEFLKSKNPEGTTVGDTVTWEACVRSVSMFGYWWEHVDETMEILRSYYSPFHSNPELENAPPGKRWFVVRSSATVQGPVLAYTSCGKHKYTRIGFDWEREVFYLLHQVGTEHRSLRELIFGELNYLAEMDGRLYCPMPKATDFSTSYMDG